MISPIVRLATRLNYRFGIRSLTKAENGVEYRTYNLYESQEPMVSEILSNIGSNDVVYDIGAHQGRYCLPLAQRAKSVHAFEPHPVVFNRLKKNIKINTGDVTASNLGVGDTAGSLTFYHSSDPQRSSFNEYNASYSGAKIERTSSIDVKTLDDYVQEHEPPDILKIDAEGFGIEILREAKN